MDDLKRYPIIHPIDKADRVSEEDLEILHKLKKTHRKLCQSVIMSSAMKDLKPIDLIVKSESELAIIMNSRLEAYNSEISRAKTLFNKIMKK